MKSLLMLMILLASTSLIFSQTNQPKKSQKVHSKTDKVMYTCPMHPQVSSSTPGNCSQCGMQLVVDRKGSKQSSMVSYTCPMHPDVVSDKAGKCPECGMTLQKKR